MWTEDPKLVAAACRYIVGLVGLSERLGSTADHPAPELAPVTYTDAAFVDYLAGSVGSTTTTAERVVQ